MFARRTFYVARYTDMYANTEIPAPFVTDAAGDVERGERGWRGHLCENEADDRHKQVRDILSVENEHDRLLHRLALLRQLANLKLHHPRHYKTAVRDGI
jgi:hypothetical protein